MVAHRLEHPTRSLEPCMQDWRGGPPLAAYLGLLAVGFTLPRPSPAERCALTAPFHPYRRKRRNIETSKSQNDLVSTFRLLGVL